MYGVWEDGESGHSGSLCLCLAPQAQIALVRLISALSEAQKHLVET
jgi:hypothetical protein